MDITHPVPKYKHWTAGAVECYKRGGVCDNCPTYELVSDRCMMKNAVLSLMREFGKPPEKLFEDEKITQERINAMFDNDLQIDYPDFLQKTIKALKKGYTSYDDLEKEVGTSRKVIAVHINGFYNILEKRGLVQRSDKPKRQAVIDFIQSRSCDIECRQNPVLPIPQEIIDYKARCEKLKSENARLQERITELENRPDTVIDFSEYKQKIKNEIEKLKNQLEAIETVEISTSNDVDKKGL